MIGEIQSLLDEYMRWLKEKTQLRQIDDWVEITTPYLDRHNDYLQIYASARMEDTLLPMQGIFFRIWNSRDVNWIPPKEKHCW